MRRRVALFVLITVATATVVTGSPWRTVVKAPRAALPDVEIALGYPGPYIPTWNAPIELRAVASRPFNGYIGWHYAVGRNKTSDGPVFSRAKLASGQQWRFASWARLEPPSWWRPAVQLDREVVVEWRDRDMQVLAEKSAGVPPWSAKRPLLIGSGPVKPVFGAEPLVVAPQDLGLSAQWYEGFSAVALPADSWAGLAPRVREVIVGSGVLVAFVGFPSNPSALPQDQRALLPVDFTPGESRYVVPWPFRDRGTSVNTSMRWRARSGSRAVGADPPPVVFNADAAWLANDALLEFPLPGVSVRSNIPVSTERRWSARAILSWFGPGIIGVVLFLVSIVAWLIARQPRWSLIALAVGAVVVAPFLKNSFRLQRKIDVVESFDDRGNGMSVHRHHVAKSGAAPVSAPLVDGSVSDTAVFANVVRWRRVAEIRDSATPMGFGARPSPYGWEVAEGAWLRRELRPAAKVKVVSVQSGRLVIDYEVPAGVEYAAATWCAGGKKFYGEIRLDDPRKGRATIPNRMFRPSVGVGELWYVDEHGAPISDWVVEAQGAAVRLFRREQSSLTQFAWDERSQVPPARGRTMSMRVWMTPTADGRLTCLLLVPPGAVAPGMTVRSNLYGNLAVSQLTVATEKFSEVLANKWGTRPLRSTMFASGIGAFELPGRLAAELSGGGVVALTADPSKPLERGQGAEAVITFQEKKS